MSATIIMLVALVGASMLGAFAQTPPSHFDDSEGKRVYQRANCIGCHKWHGGGGGGYDGDALSLRRTQLTRAQIAETVRCGRPGTGMPYHQRDAYEDGACYGVSRSELGDHKPPAAASFLRPADIEAVVDYVLARIKGKGDPDYPDCVAFFGSQSRMCHIYESESAR